LEELEIINILPEDELIAAWKPLIRSGCCRTAANFYDSWIANHPRRTGEAFMNQSADGSYIANNPLPKHADFQKLWGWFSDFALIEARVQL